MNTNDKKSNTHAAPPGYTAPGYPYCKRTDPYSK